MKKPFALLFIVLAALAVYAPAIWNGFVWDDTALVLRDPLIRSWRLIPEGFNHFLFVDATASDFYRPIQRLSYTLNYAGFAFSPGPYHLTNILFHAAAAVALFCFAEELLLAFAIPATKRGWIAFIAALVWVVHPVHSAAVVYVSGRADPLAAAFGFGGCYLLLRSLRSSRRSLLYLTGAGLVFLLSALSKESGLMFPVLACALLLVMKQVTAAWKTAVIATLVAAVYFSLRSAAAHDPAPVLHPPAPIAVRPITMARAAAEYTGLIALPVNLHMERQVNVSPDKVETVTLQRAAWRELQTLLGVVLVAGAVLWSVRAYRRNTAVFALLILTVLSYLPVSGIVGLNATVAEHWIYVPTAFLFLALTIELSRLPARWPRMLIVPASFVVVTWLVFLGVRTCIRTFDWKDQRTFLERTIAEGGDSARMLINLGGLKMSEGKLDEAKMHFEAALKKEPDQPFAIMNLAVVSFKKLDLKTAREFATRATNLPIVDAQGYELLALIDMREKGKANLLRLRLAARTGSPNWAIERRYVLFMAETGTPDAAVAELQKCLQLEWYRAESWQLLGDLLTRIGRTKEAASARSLALAYDVHLAEHEKVL